jgi:alpha-tubulin suppressor-like RCC1 family protein
MSSSVLIMIMSGRCAALQGQHVVQVDCGVEHTAAVTADGALWTWGKGRQGRLGCPPTAVADDWEAQESDVLVPRRVLYGNSRPGGGGGGGGGGSSEDQRRYAFQELAGGDGRVVGVSCEPGVSILESVHYVTEIYLCHACFDHEVEDGNGRTGGDHHTIVALANGRLVSWGDNSHGQLVRRPLRPFGRPL